jgi:glucose/arabinose dehydrogenase
MVACNRTPSTPPPPSTGTSPPDTITGNERFGWDQRAADAVELATFRYAIYVDGTRAELTGATCATTSTNGTFACSAPLPTLTRGAHTLELASFIVDGSTFESPRSSALRITVGITAPSGDQTPTRISAGDAGTPGDPFSVELVINNVDRPRDLAFAPDGRLFVVEATGSIRIVHRDGAVTADVLAGSRRSGDAADDRTLAVAIDPQFERTHFVYTLSASQPRDSDDSDAVFTVARFREANDTLAERAVILGDVRATTPHPAGSLRFGADGKLFVAFDDGADPAAIDDLASYNGKILRLNSNGTTPDDQAAASPLYASAYRSPRGFDWDPESGMLWVVDAVDGEDARIAAVAAAPGARKRGVTRTTLRLPADSRPAGIAAYRGDRLPSFQHSLLVPSVEGQHLLRIRLDPADATRILGVDRLLQNRFGAVRAVVMGPDGAVYVGVDSAIYRLIP